jgi:phage tail tape-measure protein
VIGALAALSLLAACGNQEPERAEGGAATGAATGAAIGIIGGPVGVVGGALIGGAVGGGAGAATNPRTVNLGAPPWHDNSRVGQEAARDMSH